MQKSLVALLVGSGSAQDCDVNWYPGGDWSQSCRDTSISDGHLQCQCADMSGQWWDNSVDLCHCSSYDNLDGHLTCTGKLVHAHGKQQPALSAGQDCDVNWYPGGDWSQSCRDASISDGHLQCQCADMGGQWWDNSVDLCHCSSFDNIDGHLTCDGKLVNADLKTSSSEDCDVNWYPGGDWSQSCRDTSISDGHLQCQCADMSGQWWDNNVDLCHCSSYDNLDGHLTCTGKLVIAHQMQQTLSATSSEGCDVNWYPGGDWSQSCRDASISDGHLQCQCADMGGQWWDNNVDLCHCSSFDNIDGHLTCDGKLVNADLKLSSSEDCDVNWYPGGDWSQSCRDASVSDGHLQCQCADMGGQWWDNSVDLCHCSSFDNIDGHLTCDGKLVNADRKQPALSAGEDCDVNWYPGGDWSQSCRDTSISDGHLQCQCADMSGQWWDNNVDLCHCSSYDNLDGHLTCTGKLVNAPRKQVMV